MKTIEYTTIDKSTWGDGPWQSEPDKIQYADSDTGLPCLIVRNHQGSLCGYVGVPEGHPLHGQGGYDFALSVHGGITFTGACSPHETESTGVCHLPSEGDADNVWWLGFDCGHSCDLSPAMQERYRRLGFGFFDDCQYRDLAYVKDQIESLAAQLKALT